MIANARVLGTAQGDAIQNITGELSIRNIGVHNLVFGSELGALRNLTVTNEISLGGESTSSPTPNTSKISFDASRVARTSSETRGPNTALSPRIIAY